MHNNPSRSLQEWLTWQESLHPVSIDLGLDRLRPVAERLGLTTLPMPVITVAGTNGKGSSVAFLEALLTSHGLHCGSYTSPWLQACNESTRIDGEAVRDSQLIQAFARVEQARDGAALTCFEFRTLAAADVMVSAQVAVAVLEVGLGGRLDAVNLFDAQVSLITTLGLDHQEWLGADLASIAREKAGIMRAGRVSICADEDMSAWLEPHATAVGAVFHCANRDYSFRHRDQRWEYRSGRFHCDALPLPALAGRHQLANAAGAITALAELEVLPELSPDRTALALRRARLPGRLEFRPGGRPGRPGVLLDVAHNPQACAALADWLEAHPPAGRILAVCGMYRDKDPAGCLAKLAPWVSEWHLGTLPPPRGAQAAVLEQVLADHCRSRRCYATISAAFQSACGAASDEDLVVVFGSFETVRQVAVLLDCADSGTSP